jgi:predicted nucleic acid-binding protein
VSQHVCLLDSSIWINVLRSGSSAAVVDRVDGLLSQGVAAVNGVIKLEILSGARTEKEYRDYSARFDALRPLPVVEETWSRAARLGYELRRRGITCLTADLIIAASAMEHDAVLIHADADFDRIAGNSELRVESYAAGS